VGGQRHGRFTAGKGALYPVYRSLGGPHDWPGRVWKISPSPGFHPQRVASLYTAYAVPAAIECQYGVVIVVLPTVFVFTPQTLDTKPWPSLGRNVYINP